MDELQRRCLFHLPSHESNLRRKCDTSSDLYVRLCLQNLNDPHALCELYRPSEPEVLWRLLKPIVLSITELPSTCDVRGQAHYEEVFSVSAGLLLVLSLACFFHLYYYA